MWGGGGGVTETVRSTQQGAREKVEKERQRCEVRSNCGKERKAERKRRQKDAETSAGKERK